MMRDIKKKKKKKRKGEESKLAHVKYVCERELKIAKKNVKEETGYGLG